MCMKKLILFAAMAAIAVSCAKTSEVKSVSEQAIGFDTWKSNLTKSTHAAFTSGATFNIYGYKHMGDESTHTDVFTGDVVTYNGTAWNYSNIRFWDRTTEYYTFFAIAPSGNVSSEPQPGCFVTNDITFTGRNGDILVAKKKDVAKASYGLAVDLDFVPQAALFDLKVKKAKNLEEASLRINSVSIQNIQTKGHLTVNSYDGSTKPVTAWALASSPATTNFDNTHGAPSVDLPTIHAGVGFGPSNSQFLINNLIVMPQSLNLNQKLVINYTITLGTETITHEREIFLNKFDDSDVDQDAGRTEEAQNAGDFITAWAPGKHYTYYLTINADLIVFSATISDWTDVNAYHYIIN